MRAVAIATAMTVTMAMTIATASAIEPEGRFDSAAMEHVVTALHRQCFQAGMSVSMPDDNAVLCSVTVARGDELMLRAEDLPGDVSIGRVHGGEIAHKLQFTLAERGAGVRVWAHAWLEISESDGAVLEEDIGSTAYLSRVQRVFDDLTAAFAEPAGGGDHALADVATALNAGWADHFDTEHDLRLAAHLRAVAHCNRLSADSDPDTDAVVAIDEGLRIIGLHPGGSSPRDRCEALHEVIFEWGLARGMEQPDMQTFRTFLDAQPEDQRVCMGRVALTSYCDRSSSGAD